MLLFKPCMGREEIDAVSEVLASGWTGLGPKTAEFEKRFAEYIGVKNAVGVNSCTAALDLALRLMDVKHRDEVIVPTNTFVSTAHVVAYNLATPIFADVDAETMSISIEDVERKITPRTKAIMCVHYSGRPVDYDRLREVAGDIPIIEDTAHACGGEYKGKKCGSLGELSCFSFHAVKNLSMGDGGALCCNRNDYAERAKKLRWLGIDRSTWDRSKLDKSYWWKYDVDEVGLKCHMNDIMAAIGLAQLGKLDAMNDRRRQIAERYTEGLSGVEQLKVPPADNSDFKSSWHIYWINCEKRNDLSFFLSDNKVSTGVHYTPIHTYRCYGNTPHLKTAEMMADRILSLPMYPELTDEQVDTVIALIKDFYKSNYGKA